MGTILYIDGEPIKGLSNQKAIARWDSYLVTMSEEQSRILLSRFTNQKLTQFQVGDDLFKAFVHEFETKERTGDKLLVELKLVRYPVVKN